MNIRDEYERIARADLRANGITPDPYLDNFAAPWRLRFAEACRGARPGDRGADTDPQQTYCSDVLADYAGDLALAAMQQKAALTMILEEDSCFADVAWRLASIIVCAESARAMAEDFAEDIALAWATRQLMKIG